MKMISKLRKIHKIEQKNCNKNYSAIVQVKPSMLDSHLGVHAFYPLSLSCLNLQS